MFNIEINLTFSYYIHLKVLSDKHIPSFPLTKIMIVSNIINQGYENKCTAFIASVRKIT